MMELTQHDAKFYMNNTPTFHDIAPESFERKPIYTAQYFKYEDIEFLRVLVDDQPYFVCQDIMKLCWYSTTGVARAFNVYGYPAYQILLAKNKRIAIIHQDALLHWLSERAREFREKMPYSKSRSDHQWTREVRFEHITKVHDAIVKSISDGLLKCSSDNVVSSLSLLTLGLVDTTGDGQNLNTSTIPIKSKSIWQFLANPAKIFQNTIWKFFWRTTPINR